MTLQLTFTCSCSVVPHLDFRTVQSDRNQWRRQRSKTIYATKVARLVECASRFAAPSVPDPHFTVIQNGGKQAIR